MPQFIIRLAMPQDIPNLLELSKLGNFLNLPRHESKLELMIIKSINSFQSPSMDLAKNTYFFVIEDTKEKRVMATSVIHAQHGTVDSPHFYLKVGQEKKYSQTMNKEFVHQTLRLGIDTNGPTEIGGLVVHPDYRGHQEKLGKQISFVRFLYMAINPTQFKQKIHSELMPPFDENGSSPLWEAVGKRFFEMSYHEADKLSQKNKEFILTLFPKQNIYTLLLPSDAQESIGKVGPETAPVKKMLESIGFRYSGEVDPFDGGPHYRAKVKEISLIHNQIDAPYEFTNQEEGLRDYLIQTHTEYEFSAVKVKAKFENNIFKIKSDVKDLLEENKNVRAIPLFY